MYFAAQIHKHINECIKGKKLILNLFLNINMLLYIKYIFNVWFLQRGKLIFGGPLHTVFYIKDHGDPPPLSLSLTLTFLQRIPHVPHIHKIPRSLRYCSLQNNPIVIHKLKYWKKNNLHSSTYQCLFTYS